MKVILIRPPSSQGALTETSMVQHPINLCYLAAYLIKFGHEVKIIDCEVEEFDINKILGFNPEVVGLTAKTPTIKNAASIAKEIKSKMNAIIVVGGNHLTALPKETLEEFPAFDVGVIGEGEETLKQICERKPHNEILGIVYRSKDGITINPRAPPIKNLDELPFPARHLLDMKKYKGASTPGFSREFLNITELFINRGCSWNFCTFCASEIMHKLFRTRSIDNVIAEMRECIEKYKINHFTIDDDTLTTSKERTLEFCKKVKALNITWDCDSRVAVDREMLEAMKDSNCKKIAFGVESGSQRILQLIKKGITLQQVKNTFKWCRELGIETSAFFMIGSHPDETWEELEMTKKLIKEIKPDYITASIGVPYPGTEVRRQMEERNLIFSNDWSAYALYNTKPVWRTTNFTSEDLLKIQKEMIKSFYFSPSYIIKRLSKLHSLAELKYWAKSAFGVIKLLKKKNL